MEGKGRGGSSQSCPGELKADRLGWNREDYRMRCSGGKTQVEESIKAA